MTRALRRVIALALLIGCAPAQPDWSSRHPADPDAPVGEEQPVAEVLRADPPAAPEASDEADHHGHHGHHGSPEGHDATTEENDAR